MGKAKVTFLDVEGNFGCGEKVELNKTKLASLQRVCDKFRSMLVDNCVNYAIYRITLNSDGDIIYATAAASNENGDLKETTFGVRMGTGEVYTSNLKVKNEEEVGKALYELVVNLVKLVPFVVGMLDIPAEGKFKEGFMMGYNKEKDTALIIVKDSLDNSYYREGA